MIENRFETYKAQVIEGLREIGRREVGNCWDRLMLGADRRNATRTARMMEVTDEQIEAYIKEGNTISSGHHSR